MDPSALAGLAIAAGIILATFLVFLCTYLCFAAASRYFLEGSSGNAYPNSSGGSGGYEPSTASTSIWRRGVSKASPRPSSDMATSLVSLQPLPPPPTPMSGASIGPYRVKNPPAYLPLDIARYLSIASTAAKTEGNLRRVASQPIAPVSR